MSGEIVVSETPNWLHGLEEKRERRLKVRLGHEAGAGAPCLKCGDKCPGLDLHFWRKACKICRCPKEEHDVPDDDIYGWAQFQLLGSKPNKIKTKIVLPGKKDEVELEWAPKGQKETIDKYLKTLPPEALPVKGSQAAQERKQMLQKQIPVHDIDPSLCHELNEEEVKKMEEYIAHIKKSSVGVGQIVNLSSVIKANLHNISPQEAHIIASRYSKGIPFSEIVKLQSGLASNLEKLTVNDPKNPNNKPTLPTMQPNKIGSNITEEDVQNPSIASKFKDITHPWYTDSSPHKGLTNPQYAQGFKSGHSGDLHSQNPDFRGPDYSIDQKLLQGTNFDPTRTPSQFLGYNTPGYRPPQREESHFQGQYQNKEGIPYDKLSSRPQGSDVSFSSDVEKSKALRSGGLREQQVDLPYDKVSGGFRPEDVENIEKMQGSGPNYAQNLHGSKKLPYSEQYGFENPYFNQNIPNKDSLYSQNRADTISPLKSNLKKVPGYLPGKYDPQIDTQDPKAPKSMKDLIYSTYDPSKGPLPEDNDGNSIRNTNIDPTALGYDPNITFNTYKHDPSVIKYENPPLLSKNDPAQPIGGANKHGYSPGNGKNSGQGYFDPKTGKYVPGQGHFGPGHPNYNPNNPQNRYKPVYFNSKTGEYLTGDEINPEEVNFDPRNPGQSNFDLERPSYDVKNPQTQYKPVYFDSNTGKYIPVDEIPEVGNYDPSYPGQDNNGPRHPDYDPKNPQNRYKPVYFDSKTGQYIPLDEIPEIDTYNPSNPGRGNYSPTHPDYDSKYPENRYKPVYFDSKTGKYIPVDEIPKVGNYDHSNPGQGNFSPNHPDYDFKHPQNRYKPVYFDSKTGKYIPVDEIPEVGNYDPSIPGHGNYGPRHPDYDAKNPQNRYKPVYVDSKTGKYVPLDRIPEVGTYDPSNVGQGNYGPRHADYDPKNPQNRYKPVYFDSKRGNYIPVDEIPEIANHDPGNPGQEYNDPRHPNYDTKIPQNRYKPIYFDSKTDKYIPEDEIPEDNSYDPRYPGPANYSPKHPNYDPKNFQNRYQPVYFDSKTGKYVPVDQIPEVGNYDPSNAEQGNYGPRHPDYDPKNPQNRYKPVYFDPKRGNYIPMDQIPEVDNYDPNNPRQENYDPRHPNYDSKNPQNRYKPVYFDSKTGKYIPEDQIPEDNSDDPRYPAPANYSPRHPNYDPKNPHNRYKPVYFDSKTGKYIAGDDNNPEDGNYDSSNPQNYSKYGQNRPQNIPGIDNFDPNNPEYGDYLGRELGNPNATPNKLRKPLSQLQPGHINVPEDYLEPHMVNVGAIQDINPDVRAAKTERNPGFDNESVYSDNGAEYSPESIKEILNNVKLPDCHYCKKPFEENEYAMMVDRANVLFHAQCFKCAGCNQSLADNIYFYHKDTDNVYCGRDYAKIKGYPRCTACDELIFTKEYCLAENSTFHLKHFCCFQCDTPLAGQDYTLADEKPYCLPCYETSKADKCSTCGNVIKPDEVGCQLNGVHFHAEDRCFRCIVCSVPLMGKKLLLRNDKLFCSHDCFNSVKK